MSVNDNKLWINRNSFLVQNMFQHAIISPFHSGQREVTVRRNAGPRCPSTSPLGPWRLLGQWEERGAPMAPPALLDGWRHPWCSYGCRGCYYGCRGLPKLNRWAVGDMAERCCMDPFRPHHLRHLPPPPHPLLAPHHGVLAQGRAEGSWTGCCQRRALSTGVQSTPSSERGSSRDFLPDTRFTGERDLHWLVRGFFYWDHFSLSYHIICTDSLCLVCRQIGVTLSLSFFLPACSIFFIIIFFFICKYFCIYQLFFFYSSIKLLQLAV